MIGTNLKASHPRVHNVHRCVSKAQPFGDVRDLEADITRGVARLDGNCQAEGDVEMICVDSSGLIHYGRKTTHLDQAHGILRGGTPWPSLVP